MLICSSLNSARRLTSSTQTLLFRKLSHTLKQSLMRNPFLDEQQIKVQDCRLRLHTGPPEGMFHACQVRHSHQQFTLNLLTDSRRWPTNSGFRDMQWHPTSPLPLLFIVCFGNGTISLRKCSALTLNPRTRLCFRHTLHTPTSPGHSAGRAQHWEMGPLIHQASRVSLPTWRWARLQGDEGVGHGGGGDHAQLGFGLGLGLHRRLGRLGRRLALFAWTHVWWAGLVGRSAPGYSNSVGITTSHDIAHCAGQRATFGQ